MGVEADGQLPCHHFAGIAQLYGARPSPELKGPLTLGWMGLKGYLSTAHAKAFVSTGYSNQLGGCVAGVGGGGWGAHSVCGTV